MDDLAQTPITAAILRGFIELEQTALGILPHRLPAPARAQCSNPQLLMVEAQPSGVHFRFRTAATTIELDVLPVRHQLVGVPARPDGVYDLCIKGRLEQQRAAPGATILRTDMSTGTTTREQAPPQTLRFADLPTGEKTVELWLPHYEATELVALRSNAPIAPVAEPTKRVWLHHGSSISQGSNATSPTRIWPVIAAQARGLDLVNLGFGGSALLDPLTARTISETPADIISVKIGINLVNQGVMDREQFGPAVHSFLDIIRQGHPETPIVVISPLLCPIHETVPGPGAFDLEALAQGEIKFLATGGPEEVAMGRLTLTAIREDLSALVESRAISDQAIRYLDGRMLYGEPDNARLPLPDRLPPDTETHALIGDRFARYLEQHEAQLMPV